MVGGQPADPWNKQPEPTGPRPSLARAVLTDVQFWIPLGVLAGGLALLVGLR